MFCLKPAVERLQIVKRFERRSGLWLHCFNHQPLFATLDTTTYLKSVWHQSCEWDNSGAKWVNELKEWLPVRGSTAQQWSVLIPWACCLISSPWYIAEVEYEKIIENQDEPFKKQWKSHGNPVQLSCSISPKLPPPWEQSTSSSMPSSLSFPPRLTSVALLNLPSSTQQHPYLLPSLNTSLPCPSCICKNDCFHVHFE